MSKHPFNFGSRTDTSMITQSLNESVYEPPVTTQAVGEEGGKPPITTQALGEEGNPPIKTK